MPVTAPCRYTRGFALVESLVAMTVLSASLAVAAAALVQTLHQVRRASERSAALRLATSLAEELRGLRRSDGRALRAMLAGRADAVCAGTAGDCAAETTAAARLAEWRAQVANALPAGASGDVSVPDPLRPDYAIELSWPDATGAGVARLRLEVRT